MCQRAASPTFRSSVFSSDERVCIPQPAKRDVSPTFRSSVCIGDPSLCTPMVSLQPRSPSPRSRQVVPGVKTTCTRSGSPGRSCSPTRRTDRALGSDQACGASARSIATACWQRFGADNGSSAQDFNPCQLPSPSRSRCRQSMSLSVKSGDDSSGIHQLGGDSWTAWTRNGKDYVPMERPLRGASPGKSDSSSMWHILQGNGCGPQLSPSPSSDRLSQASQPPWLHLDACKVQNETNTRRRSPRRRTELDGNSVSNTLHNDGHIDGTRERLLSPRAHCGKDSVRNLSSSIFSVDECSRTHTGGALLQDWQVIHSARSRRNMNAHKNASNGLSTILAQGLSMPSAGSRGNEMTAESSIASGNMSPRELTPESHNRRKELRADAVRQWDAAVNPDRPANVPLSDRARAAPLSDRARATVVQRRGR